MLQSRKKVYLVVGGQYHDMDFARLELLKMLAREPAIRTTVAANYEDVAAIEQSDLLITYTCNLIPSEAIQLCLKSFLENGGRWLALHGTNSILEFTRDSKQVHCPQNAPVMMKLLGSQFMAHPPMSKFTVTVRDPSHPVVDGVSDFNIEDELYLSQINSDIKVILDVGFAGDTKPFVKDSWEEARHPILYSNQVGLGEVLYFNLGHCRGHWDMPEFTDYYPDIEKGPWDLPVFNLLLWRSLQWCLGAYEEKGEMTFKGDGGRVDESRN